MKPTIAALAILYKASSRTLYRYKRRGVNIENPLAIAEHIATNPRTPLRIIEAVTDILSNDGKQLSTSK